MNIPAAVFKAECLKLMDEVARTGKPIVITKHGKPVARLMPISPQAESLFGYMKNTVAIKGDVLSPMAEAWSALDGEEDLLLACAPKNAPNRGTRLKK